MLTSLPEDEDQSVEDFAESHHFSNTVDALDSISSGATSVWSKFEGMSFAQARQNAEGFKLGGADCGNAPRKSPLIRNSSSTVSLNMTAASSMASIGTVVNLETD